jgi:hypothetical protein
MMIQISRMFSEFGMTQPEIFLAAILQARQILVD